MSSLTCFVFVFEKMLSFFNLSLSCWEGCFILLGSARCWCLMMWNFWKMNKENYEIMVKNICEYHFFLRVLHSNNKLCIFPTWTIVISIWMKCVKIRWFFNLPNKVILQRVFYFYEISKSLNFLMLEYFDKIKF